MALHILAHLAEAGDPPITSESASHGYQIEAAAGGVLDGFYAEAEALLLRRLDKITHADLVANLRRRPSGGAKVDQHSDVLSG